MIFVVPVRCLQLKVSLHGSRVCADGREAVLVKQLWRLVLKRMLLLTWRQRPVLPTPCAMSFKLCICNVVHHQQILFSLSAFTYSFGLYANPGLNLLAYHKPGVDTGLDTRNCCCIHLADCSPTVHCCVPSSKLFLFLSRCVCEACPSANMAHNAMHVFASNAAWMLQSPTVANPKCIQSQHSLPAVLMTSVMVLQKNMPCTYPSCICATVFVPAICVPCACRSTRTFCSAGDL